MDRDQRGMNGFWPKRCEQIGAEEVQRDRDKKVTNVW